MLVAAWKTRACALAYFQCNIKLSILLFGLRDTNSVLAEVVDGVVAAEESITKNGERASRRRHVHAHKGRDAAAANFENVVLGRERIVGTRKVEGHVGQRTPLLAVDGVLATEALLSANLLVEKFSKVGGESVQRRASVENDASVLHLSNLVAKSNGLEVDLPVSLAPKGDVVELALIFVLVDATKDNFALVIFIGNVEGEDGFVQEFVVDHLVEGRDNAVDGNGIIAEAEDAIEAAKGKCQTGLARCLCKVLVLNLEVADLEDVVGDKAGQASAAVADLKLGAVLLIGGGRRRVIC